MSVLRLVKQKVPTIIAAGAVMTCVMMSPSFGVTVEDHQAPTRSLKSNVIGGGMMPFPVINIAVDIGFSFFKQSFLPIGLSVWSVAGIHFFESYLADGAAGALI